MKNHLALRGILVATALFSLGFSIKKFYSFEENTRLEAFLDGAFPRVSSGYYVEETLTEIFDNWVKGDITNLQRIPNSDYILVVAKQGYIYAFKDGEGYRDRHLVADMRHKVVKYYEQGLYQILFHPEFGNEESPFSNDVFLYYTQFHQQAGARDDPNYNTLSRFKFSPEDMTIDLASEDTLIFLYDRNYSHQGGSMFFDKDQFLYLSIGDEGAAGNVENTQKINESLYSGIIRIDVNNDSSRSHPIRRQPIERERREGYPRSFTRNYMIPNENPWTDISGKNLEEFYAIGFRNPYSMHYDTVSGKIIVGDVGHLTEEEITIVEKGGNGQWSYMEGLVPAGFIERPDEIIGTETPPIHTYGRDEGFCIIGGGVYRGNLLEELHGKYIFGDYVSQKVWAMDIESGETELLCSIPISQLVKFHFEPDGRILMITRKGSAYELKHQAPGDFPELLSETGAFEDLSTLTIKAGIIPYGVNAPLWSDNASKQRWVSIPEHEVIEFCESDAWKFPVGTVFIKHFELNISPTEKTRLETRFLVVDENKDVYGITYMWNEDQTNAELISPTEALERTITYTDGQVLHNQTWDFPTRAQCTQCHNRNAGYILGVKTIQLNGLYEYDSEHNINQLELWNHLGMFDKNIDYSSLEELPKAFHISDTNASLTSRVRSYIDANCSFCHRPDGVEAAFDARMSTPLAQQNIINADVESRNSSGGNKIIYAELPNKSEIYLRDNSLASEQMPPLAKSINDTTYIRVLKNWINSLIPIKTVISETLCVGDKFVFPDGSEREIFRSEADTFYYVSQLNLDSLVITDLTVKDYNFHDSVQVCAGDSYTMPDGTFFENIEEQLSHTSILESALGCDSTIISTVTIKPIFSLEHHVEVCAGDSYTMPDGTFFENIEEQLSHISILESALGCDSTIISTVTIKPIFSLEHHVEVCAGDSYTMPDGTFFENIEEQLSHTSILESALGCDSTIISTVTIKPIFSLEHHVEVCAGDSYTMPDGTFFENIEEQLSHTSILESALGCDSTIISTVTIKPIFSLEHHVEVCAGDSYTMPDGTFFENIEEQLSHTSILESALGCDSTIISTVTIKPIFSLEHHVEVCAGDSYTMPDGTFFENIEEQLSHTSILESALGCDSTIISTVTIKPIFSLEHHVEVCAGDSYTMPDGTFFENIEEQLSHTSILESALGCDSTIISTVTIKPIFSLEHHVEVCAGDSYTMPDGTFFENIEEQLSHTSILESALGCDSTVITNIKLCPPLTSHSFDNIIIYPNPIKREFFIKNLTDGTEVKMYSLSGKRVNLKLGGGKRILIKESLPGGIYFLYLNKVNESQIIKVVIEN